MRVLESAPVALQSTMGKRKHKLRKQAKENELGPAASDSSDDGSTATGRGCPHLNKAVNINALRKALKQVTTIGECNGCIKDGSVTKKPEEGGDEAAGATGGAEAGREDEVFEGLEPTIWICLQCGYQGCDRNSAEKHSMKHYQTPRSASHALVINVSSWSIWCYDCDDEVLAESSGKLQECVEYVQKIALLPARPESTSGNPAPVKRSGSFRGEANEAVEPSATQQELAGNGGKDSKVLSSRPRSAGSSQAAASVTQALPKVKGLSNLGNTCFFNAVMQNLTQTYELQCLLNGRVQKCLPLPLPGHHLDNDADEYSDGCGSGSDDEKEKRPILDAVNLTLGECGALTSAVLSFLRDMHSPGKSNTISPSTLFGQVCKKAPRFKGFQQQDSHELLRHLLDGMKAEEVKRSQVSILRHFHLPENINAKKVDEETKLKIKEYGRQVKHTFVDSLFGGYFISTVLCEECQTPSQIFEPFLDISLPIMEEKTVRPNSMFGRRKKSSTEEAAPVKEGSHTGSMDGTVEDRTRPSQKKVKAQAKREAKRKGGGKERKGSKQDDDCGDTAAGKDAEPAEGNAEKEESEENTKSRSQSGEEFEDADIEDNLEDVRLKGSTPFTNQHQSSKKASEHLPKEAPTSSSRTHLVNFNLKKPVSRTNSIEEAKGDRSSSPVVKSRPSSRSDKEADGPGLVGDVTEKLRNLQLAGQNQNQNLNQTNESKCHSESCRQDSCHCQNNGANCEAAAVRAGTSASLSSSSTSAVSSACQPQRSHSQLQLEAKMMAMKPLVSRYHAVSHECSIQSCLNQFTAPELLMGSNKFSCGVCTRRKSQTSRDGKKVKVYTNASKQVQVFSPPAVLTIHLKRFQQIGFTLRKVNRHVEFPLVLDIAPYCSSLCQGINPDQTKVMYSLYGVVEHSGRLSGGHYTAYIKVRPNSTCRDFILADINGIKLERLLEAMEACAQGHSDQGQGQEEAGQAEAEPTPPPGRWYYISDSRVTEVVNESHVLRCQAYILFYERIY